ncbi:GAF domain-containing sensor histidine kinase [Mycobacterium nebraskense]|nr:GAF domain-containing protein [Mycobacterium nebraskense]MBI2695791.1 GAF domain-containing protein [Mycobacterium nebraskense]MCV7119321.1 GAF domain-containing protein [Mycobacterium nebraskense]
MHEQLDELVADRQQMGQLLQVAIEIGSDLELDAILHRIVAAAIGMTGARYGAIGVWGLEGTLASFVHSGMDPETVRLVGHLPVGKGVLGALRDRTEPLRLTDLSDHPTAVGFPEHHPPMRAFLGMPVIIRGAVFGSLYVTDDRPGRCFGEPDEITLQALASAASVAIDNARLFDRVRAGARWTDASREISNALLSESHPDLRPLQLIVERAAELTDAEQAIVLVPTDPDQPSDGVDRLVVSAAVGVHAEEVLGQEVPVQGSTTGEVFRTGRPVLTETFRRPIPAFTDLGERPAILMPLRSDQQTLGVIAVARNTDAPPFDEEHLELVRDFADHAAIALTLATERRNTRELSVLVDRERIARDLHDQVISRVFAVGTDLQGVAAHLRSPQLAARLTQSVTELQDVIDDIRRTVFDLQQQPARRRSFAERVQDAIARLADDDNEGTTLRMAGTMTAVSDELAEHAEAFVSEALSDAVRHSRAGTIAVEITVTDELLIEITDDGRGAPSDQQDHGGLDEIARRVKDLGGECAINSAPSGGTRVRWSAPLQNS